jgi:NDP-sugar pyrophosphorylase family protein
MKITKAFILAGGKGERLRPLTLEMPKVMIEVKGKPVLQWNMELAKKFGVKDFVLAVGYKHEQIEKRFGDGSALGVKITYNVEDSFLGTAGALKFAESHFKDEERFIMMNGDECKSVDFFKLNGVFERNRAIAAIALTEVDYTAAGGIVATEGERVLRFDEKPKEESGGCKMVNAGAYILSPKIFGYISEGRTVSIEKEVFPWLAEEGKAFAVPCVKSFLQTDTFKRLERAKKEWRGL